MRTTIKEKYYHTVQYNIHFLLLQSTLSNLIANLEIIGKLLEKVNVPVTFAKLNIILYPHKNFVKKIKEM